MLASEISNVRELFVSATLDEVVVVSRDKFGRYLFLDSTRLHEVLLMTAEKLLSRIIEHKSIASNR